MTAAPAYGSVIMAGGRYAAVLEPDRVGLTNFPGLDEAVGSGGRLTDHVVRWVDRADVEIDTPLHPPVFFCLGQTYSSHVREKEMTGFAANVRPTEPEFFIKAGQTALRPGAPFELDSTRIRKLDYETELGVVIGRPADRVPVSAALDHVYGYLVINDVTARERQVRTASDGSTRMAADAAKNFAHATWLSPSVVPRELIQDLSKLTISTRVNNELRQLDTLDSLLFNVAELVSYLSYLLPLLPGTVIATGTPGGTGWSMDPELGGTGTTPAGCVPGRYLQVGDEVVSEVEEIGRISTRVVPPAQQPPQ